MGMPASHSPIACMHVMDIARGGLHDEFLAHSCTSSSSREWLADFLAASTAACFSSASLLASCLAALQHMTHDEGMAPQCPRVAVADSYFCSSQLQ